MISQLNAGGEPPLRRQRQFVKFIDRMLGAMVTFNWQNSAYFPFAAPFRNALKRQ